MDQKTKKKIVRLMSIELAKQDHSIYYYLYKGFQKARKRLEKRTGESK